VGPTCPHPALPAANARCFAAGELLRALGGPDSRIRHQCDCSEEDCLRGRILLEMPTILKASGLIPRPCTFVIKTVDYS